MSHKILALQKRTSEETCNHIDRIIFLHACYPAQSQQTNTINSDQIYNFNDKNKTSP